MNFLKKIKAKSIHPSVLIAQRIKAQCSTCSGDAWDANVAHRTCVLLGQKCDSHSPGLQCLCLVCVDGGGRVSREQQYKEKLCID